MKALVLSLALLAVPAVHASVVLESPTIPMAIKTEAKFEINRKTDTAWVVLQETVRKHGGRGDIRDIVYEKEAKVEGLSFDAATNTVVLDKDGALTECATVELRGISIFRYNKITPTNCKLVIKKVNRANSRYTNTQVHLIAE